jgi:hypothetical protein
MSLEDKISELIEALSKDKGVSSKRTSKEVKETIGNLEGIEAVEALKKSLEDVKLTQDLINKRQEDYIGKEKIIEEIEQKRLNRVKDIYETAVEQTLKKEKELILAQQEIEQLEKAKKLQEEGQEISEEDKKIQEKRLETLKKQTEEINSQLPDLIAARNEAEKALAIEKKRLESEQAIKSILTETYNEFKKIAFSQEAHIINISKLTGGYASFLGNIREASRLSQAATLGSGVTGEQVNKAMGELATNFKNLSSYSAESISAMTVASAQLEKIGVSGASATKSFDSLVNAMGKTPQQAVKIQESFVQMAAKNKMSLAAVNEAFAANSERFIGYGNKMQEVLEGISYQALQTGVSMQGLINVAAGFDTFEDAARKVGSLNALLGGDYLNSIEMLTASDEERIKMMREAVAASGMEWESMNRFQQKAIANAAGIRDVNDAAKMFGKQSKENAKAQAEQAEVQKTLAEQSDSVSLSMDKLQSTLNGLFIAIDPIVSILRTFVDILTFFPNLVSKVGGTLGQVLSALTSLGIFIGLLAIKNRFMGGSWNYVATSITRASAALARYRAQAGIPLPPPPSPIPTSGAPIGATTPAGAAGAGRFTSFINNINPGNLIRAAGALAILAAALGLMALALMGFASVAEKGGGVAGGAAGLAVISLTMLVIAAKYVSAASTDIIKGAVVIGILGAAILLVGLAMMSFAQVDWKLVMSVGLILTGIGLAIAGLGYLFTNPLVMGGIIAGIAIIVAIGIGLKVLGDSLKNIADSISKASPSIAKLGDALASLIATEGLSGGLTKIESFLSQLSQIDYDPIKNLANSIKTLADSLERLNKISNGNLEGIEAKFETISVSSAENTNKVINISKEIAGYEANAQAATIQQSRSAASTMSNAAQNVTYVPVEVYVGKDKIFDLFKNDFEKVALKKASIAIDASVKPRSAINGSSIDMSSLICPVISNE